VFTIARIRKWIVPDDADTNYSINTACAYDRIIITKGMVEHYNNNWGIDTVSSKAVSDHFPVWAEFSAGQHN
jgi:endonuclease/exonuclease/phosphatase family metal-dependent hydrolase